VEVEKKNIQEVIRQRVMVEREVVEEEEKIRDTREFAAADRKKRVAVTAAEEVAQQQLVTEVQAAEAEKQSAERQAETVIIKADADREAAFKQTEAKKALAEATQAETAASGLGEAQVKVAMADAIEKEGTAEARVMELKFAADARGITEKAEAMKLFDGVGREHEEYKLQLNKDREIELRAIAAQQEIAEAQAAMVAESLKSANIDIVGGDNQFFESIVRSITAGKQVDRLIEGSRTLSDVKETFFTGDPDTFREKMQYYVDLFGTSSNDIKNLSVAALVGTFMSQTTDKGLRGQLESLLDMAGRLGLSDNKASSLKLSPKSKS
jgi:hypothetical protein